MLSYYLKTQPNPMNRRIRDPYVRWCERRTDICIGCFMSKVCQLVKCNFSMPCTVLCAGRLVLDYVGFLNCSEIQSKMSPMISVKLSS